MVKISKHGRRGSRSNQDMIIVLLIMVGTTGFTFLAITWLNSLLSIWREDTSNKQLPYTKQLHQVGPIASTRWDDDIDDNSIIMREYAKLRVEHELKYPISDTQRMKEFAKSIRDDPYQPIYTVDDKEIDYDVFNCPDHPSDNYPKEWNVLEVIQNWNPDDPDPPQKPHIYQGLCVFQHSSDYQKALNYRNAEKPFIIRDDPLILETVERWNQEDYLSNLLGSEIKHRTEYSHDNHFMYWKSNPNRETPNFTPPTENIHMTYAEWLQKAKEMEEKSHYEKNKDHWYFRLNSCRGKTCKQEKTNFLFREVPFLKPHKSFYIVDEDETRGINCRFGMKGNIAENHFDSSRNMIAIFKGERRYILSHPSNCPNLCLYPKGHPSGRHSAIDWSQPDLEEFPLFQHATVNEVVLQAGDVLYLPTFWFHYIISLNINYQCNGRSGVTTDHRMAMHKCGF